MLLSWHHICLFAGWCIYPIQAGVPRPLLRCTKPGETGWMSSLCYLECTVDPGLCSYSDCLKAFRVDSHGSDQSCSNKHAIYQHCVMRWVTLLGSLTAGCMLITAQPVSIASALQFSHWHLLTSVLHAPFLQVIGDMTSNIYKISNLCKQLSISLPGITLDPIGQADQDPLPPIRNTPSPPDSGSPNPVPSPTPPPPPPPAPAPPQPESETFDKVCLPNGVCANRVSLGGDCGVMVAASVITASAAECVAYCYFQADGRAFVLWSISSQQCKCHAARCDIETGPYSVYR